MSAQQHVESGQRAQALAQYLRQNPEGALQRPDVLARNFDLSPEFVREVLRGVQAAPRERRGATMAPLLRPFAAAYGWLINGFVAITARPLPFVALTVLAALIFFQIVPGVTVVHAGQEVRSVTTTAVANYTLLAVIVLHILCYYRHARSRWPLKGAVICWLLTAPPFMVTMWNVAPAEKESTPAVLIAVAVGLLSPWLIYAMVGIFASLIGAYVRIRRVDRQERLQARQQLLERLFEIQEKLSKPGEAIEDQKPLFIERWRRLFVRWPWLLAIALGFTANLSKVLMISGAVALVNLSESYVPLLATGGVIFFGVYTLSLAVVGYFAGSIWRALILSIVFLAAAFPADLIPLAPFGPHIVQSWTVGMLFINLLQVVLVSSFAALGAFIEDRANKERRLKQDDPAALLAEMVRIQWRLTPTTSNICVVVVDAARSADMKAAADPLKVEYSFREYQNLLADVTDRHGGNVHNTAGDGAVLAFKSCQDAFSAAREIQTQIERFNREANRLDTPFRLRVGLHTGTVAGELDKVEFAEVIDIAAHVQAAAPVGGIAVTEAVVHYLPAFSFAQLQGTIDGCKVYIAMTPTLDA